MSSTIESKGRCLCGAVQIKAKTVDTNVGACHCNMCRKWTGGPLLVVDCKSDVEIKGEDNVVRYASSEWAQRGFCASCGTHLFYLLLKNNQYMVPAGFFECETDLRLDHQIFTDEKPTYYSFSNDTKNMTGEEVFAFFAAE